MKRKITVILTAMCLMFSLVACENNGSNSDMKVASSTENIAESDSKDEAVETSRAVQTDIKDKTQNATQEHTQGDNQQAEDKELITDTNYANLPESEGFVFESNGDGTCTLTKIGMCSDKDIVIPENSPEGDKITKIAEYAFYGVEDITSIIFAGRTMELENNAFQSCEVEKIVITGCDFIIGESAFSYCGDVSEIYISNSTIEINSYAFYDCGKDMDIKIVNCTGVLDENAFQSCKVAGLTINDSILELGENVFSYCKDLTTVAFDNCTVEIESYAFYDSGDDVTITFTNCGLEMDDSAFQCCCLTELNISGGETVMGENAFSYCDDLTEVIISGNSTEIGTYSFYDCTALVNVSIAPDSEDDSIKIIIDDNAFQSCSVQNVVIGRGEVEIGDRVFSYCEELTNVEIKGALLKKGEYVFYDCPDELIITYNGAAYNRESIEGVK